MRNATPDDPHICAARVSEPSQPVRSGAYFWSMRPLGALLVLAVIALVVMPAAARADTSVIVGPAQRMLGYSSDIDSPWLTYRGQSTRVVRHHVKRAHPLWFHRHHPHRAHWRYRIVRHRVTHGQLFGLMGMRTVTRYQQHRDGTLSDATPILQPGPPGSPDACGVHPSGIFKATPTHWVLFYHAEQPAPGEECTSNRAEKHTRWTIRRMDSWNAGRTWVKGGAVISQDTNLLVDPATGLWNYRCDDTGEAHLLVAGGWLYLVYDACTGDGRGREESIARAPVSSLGVPGSWLKWDGTAFAQPGLGGSQAPLEGLPTGARGISWNTYTHSWLAASVHIEGGALFESSDLIHWAYRSTLFATGLHGSVWGLPCDPAVGEGAAYGYGSIIGSGGSVSTSGRVFWLYYMVKPAGRCFTDGRLLVRREVAL